MSKFTAGAVSSVGSQGQLWKGSILKTGGLRQVVLFCCVFGGNINKKIRVGSLELPVIYLVIKL